MLATAICVVHFYGAHHARIFLKSFQACEESVRQFNLLGFRYRCDDATVDDHRSHVWLQNHCGTASACYFFFNALARDFGRRNVQSDNADEFFGVRGSGVRRS
jgi:hypothetical protein